MSLLILVVTNIITRYCFILVVSDPVIFGQCVRAYFKELVEKHEPLLDELGVEPENIALDDFG